MSKIVNIAKQRIQKATLNRSGHAITHHINFDSITSLG